MTRRTVLVWALAALGGGTLLWSAWRVLSTDLSTTGRVLASVLWLLLAAAVATFFLYVRELVRQRVAITRGARWQPVPAVALLWLGGASSLVVFTALMPATAAPAPRDAVAPPRTPASVAADPGSAAAARTSATSSSRTQQRTPAPTTTSAPAPRVASTPTPTSTTSLPTQSTTTTQPSTTTTTTPIIDLTIPGKPVKPTKPPGQ